MKNIVDNLKEKNKLKQKDLKKWKDVGSKWRSFCNKGWVDALEHAMNLLKEAETPKGSPNLAGKRSPPGITQGFYIMKTIKITIPIVPTPQMRFKFRSYIPKEVSEELKEDFFDNLTLLEKYDNQPVNLRPLIDDLAKALVKSVRTLTYKDPKQVANEEELLLHLKKYRPEKPLQGAVFVLLNVFVPIPQSWSNKKKIRANEGEIFPVTKPDFSNYLKQIEDVLEKAGFVRNDSIIVRYLNPGKYYSQNPRWEITLIAIEE